MKRTRIDLSVMVVADHLDPEDVAREVYENAIRPYVKAYDGGVLAIPVGNFVDASPVSPTEEDR